MAIERSSGLLLHITSLPGTHGCGTLGREAEEFIAFLSASGQSYWQVLPLGPVCPHWNFSPYSSPSAFAGNEMLVSPEPLLAAGWLNASEMAEGREEIPGDFCDLPAVAERKAAWLAKAGQRFFQAGGAQAGAFLRFCAEEQSWLDDYALFRALADRFQTFQWSAWPGDIARRESGAVARWQGELQAPIRLRQFEQFLFFEQWRALKRHANQNGVRIIGDIPFYVNFESADAWSRPDIFQVDEKTGLPGAVAGVPPDYFSATGQRWGNPLYRWQRGASGLQPATLAWWTRRVGHMLRLVDVLRIDHFRGFDTYWAIPACEPTAVKGQWKKGPGMAFFDHLRRELGDLPLVAEDLGELTPGVEALRDELGFPGMKILQFAFDGRPDNPYLPHNYGMGNCLVYTGTHDNNTSNGWFYGPETDEAAKRRVLDYMNLGHRDEFHWHFIRLAMQSVARLAVFPVQDILGYGERFRMNTPGNAEGNWRWRLRPGALTPETGRRLLHLTQLYGRRPTS